LAEDEVSEEKVDDEVSFTEDKWDGCDES